MKIMRIMASMVVNRETFARLSNVVRHVAVGSIPALRRTFKEERGEC